MKATRDRSIALLITRNLPPLIGGMERLVWHIADELRAEYRVHVIGPAGCTRHLSEETAVHEIPIKPIYRFLFRAVLTAILQAIRIRPKLVFAGSGLAAPFAWLAARLVKAHCIVYLHGLDIEARSPLYRILWLPFIRRCDKVLINSHFTRQLAIQVGISPARIFILHPGVTLPDTHKAAKMRDEFRARNGIGHAPMMLYVGRITARKGLTFFVEHILPGIIKALPRAELVVIGDEPYQAVLQGESEMQRIRQALDISGLSKHVHFLGSRAFDAPEITAAYFSADVHVFPVQYRPGDNEGFGMVAIEAAAHGLPTVAFAVGGVVDAVRDRCSGRLVPAGDVAGFTQHVIEIVSATPTEKSTWGENAQTFAAQFAWANFGRNLLTICKSYEQKNNGNINLTT